MYHVPCQVGAGAVLLPRSPLVPLRDKEVACHSFSFLWLIVPHPSSKALERGWWVILEEELWFFYGHAQAALWRGQGPALNITTHKSPLSQRELEGQPHLTAHSHSGESKERANCAWDVVTSQHRSLWGCPMSPETMQEALETLGHVSRCVCTQRPKQCRRVSTAAALPLRSNIWTPNPLTE